MKNLTYHYQVKNIWCPHYVWWDSRPSSHSQDKLFVLTRIYSTKSISKINWNQHSTHKQAPRMSCVNFLLSCKYLIAICWIMCCHLTRERHFHLVIGFLYWLKKKENFENALHPPSFAMWLGDFVIWFNID